VQQALDASEDCIAALSDNRAVPGFRPALEAIERLLGIEPDAATAEEPPATVASFQPAETVRITAQNFDGLLRSAGGLLAESQHQDQVTMQLNALARHIAGMAKEAAAARRTGRRESSRVRSFFDSIEQHTRALSRQASDVRRAQQRSSWTIGHLGKQLQQDVWRARMVPAESLVEGYRKMIRDLARDEAKEIDFRATCIGVHADRGVLDALKDPLMHVLRNAVSHGIEKPAERLAKGKSPVGLVTLRIEVEGQRLTVAVEDDGRGVDFARVTEVAVRQGLVPEAEAARHSQRDLARVLFRPGFSTSRSITNLSGRGMGLSVVYEAVRRLQGDVELAPGDSAGVAIHLSVPLSISTHRLLLVSCGGQPFAIPVHGIERLHRAGRESLASVEGKPVISLDGQTLPLYSLQQLLRLESSQQSGDTGDVRIMVLRSKGNRAAIAVDSFLRESDAVIQHLGPAGSHDDRIAGGIVLEAGGVAIVLNVKELLETAGQGDAAVFPMPLAPVPEPSPHSILVVDDSMTTRTLEKSILEAHGFRVRVAVDGLDALMQLRTEAADLVIADVQMPRMDGFELLQAMKKDAKLERTPVIIVTSLDRREDQERGLGLGADAYIVKRKFDQEELLTAIRQIL